MLPEQLYSCIQIQDSLLLLLTEKCQQVISFFKNDCVCEKDLYKTWSFCCLTKSVFPLLVLFHNEVHDGSHTDLYFCYIGEEEDKEVI